MSITDTVIPIIRETRAMLLPQWGNVEIEKQKSDSPSDVVTALDLAVETFLREKLSSVYPDISFAGEEFGGSREKERFWLCDPIDGTAHYLRGMPFCTVMLALIEEGKVTFGVIYDFINDIAYHAERGKGAYRNGERISVSDRSMADAYFAWESHIEKQQNLEKYQRLMEKMVTFHTISSGFEFSRVATGTIEARIHFDPYGKDYDFAPGSLLVEEAGGMVANLGSRSYDYRNLNFIAANPKVFAELTEGPDAIFPITES